MLEKKKYPVTVVEDIAIVLKYFYSIENQYQDILEMNFTGSHLVEIKDKEASGFRFVVSTPSQGSDRKTYLRITKNPKTVTSNDESNVSVLSNEVEGHFKTWVSILKRYDSVSLTKEDLYAKDEEKQFYDEFEIIDNDSEIKALPVESQFKVYQLLEELQARLELRSESNPEVKNIIKDAETLKANIQYLPQSAVAKRIAKIKVGIKKIGIKFFLDVVDVAYKEAIKFALQGGVDGIHKMLS